LTSTVIAALVILIGIPLNWYVTWRLWSLSRDNPELRVLRERAIVALVLAFVITMFAVVFINNDLVPPPLSFETTKWVTRTVVLVASIVPPCYWLWLYRDK
jgi:hypothetical protein